MSAKIIQFEIPNNVRQRYVEPEEVFDKIDLVEFDASQTLGPVGVMMKEHKHTVLNWIDYNDFMKPFSDWKGTTKEAFTRQKLSFNSKLDRLGECTAILIGGEEVVLKRGKFVIGDICHDRQELGRILKIVTEVLFFEAIVYCPETLTYMQVEDYQIKELIFDK